MEKSQIKDGDIVMMCNTNWDYTKHVGTPYKAIILWKGFHNQPLYIRCEDMQNGIYDPCWGTYESITEIIGHIDLTDLLKKTTLEHMVEDDFGR